MSEAIAMNSYIYVRCTVMPANPEITAAYNSIVEKVFGPTPDVINNIHAHSMSFEHVYLSATNEDRAYLLGYRLLPKIKSGAIAMNDYVIKL